MTNVIAKMAAMFTKLAAHALGCEEQAQNGHASSASEAWRHYDHIDELQSLDFDHLAGFTSNSRSNEQKLLRLFREQAARDLDHLRQAGTTKDWQRAAHSMKGSAAAIGAWRIAQTAATAMQLEANGSDPEAALLLRELTAHLAQVNHIIAHRLDENSSTPDELAEGRTLRDRSPSPGEVG